MKRSSPLTSTIMSFCLVFTIVVAAGHAAPRQLRTLSLDEKLTILQKSYPSTIKDIRDGKVFYDDGSSQFVDDGEEKTHQGKLKQADIEDMLSQTYPVGKCRHQKPPENFDPGRIRNDKFMRALFGKTKQDVASQTKSLNWFGTSLKVTTRQGVDEALTRVRDDLEKLPKRFLKYLVKPAGTFVWRNIAGTKRLSVHSFAAAIDISIKHADYWRWAGGKPGNVPNYKNKIPAEIVDAFERHGFIWGGKWYHFDTMHFEYRPDLIEIGRRVHIDGCLSAK